MLIHCAIDGYSRFITFFRCSDNNRSATSLEVFNEGTCTFSMPKHIRTDHGWEDIGVGAAYGNENNLVFTNKSVHNQRADRNKTLAICITSPFKEFFEELEMKGNLNLDYETNIFCLHSIYLIASIKHYPTTRMLTTTTIYLKRCHFKGVESRSSINLKCNSSLCLLSTFCCYLSVT